MARLAFFFFLQRGGMGGFLDCPSSFCLFFSSLSSLFKGCLAETSRPCTLSWSYNTWVKSHWPRVGVFTLDICTVIVRWWWRCVCMYVCVREKVKESLVSFCVCVCVWFCMCAWEWVGGETREVDTNEWMNTLIALISQKSSIASHLNIYISKANLHYFITILPLFTVIPLSVNNTE